MSCWRQTLVLCSVCIVVFLVVSAGIVYRDVQFWAEFVFNGTSSGGAPPPNPTAIANATVSLRSQISYLRGVSQGVTASNVSVSRPTPSPTRVTTRPTPEPTACLHQGLVKYWKTVPKDKDWRSPFAPPVGSPPKYVTFDPDSAQWNNKRMAMETVVVFASAMGRTLVLPPAPEYTINFDDVLQLDGIDRKALRIISVQQYARELPDGISKPPSGVMDALLQQRKQNTLDQQMVIQVSRWMMSVGYQPDFRPGKNFMAFPPTPDSELNMSAPRIQRFMKGGRKPVEMNMQMKTAPVLHLSNMAPNRLLAHFYAFIYFESVQMDKYYKRLVRDALHYRDTVTCKAALVSSMLRDEGNGKFNAAHVRRNDFGRQYEAAILKPEQIREAFQTKFHDGDVVYIATDEKDKAYFRAIGQRYKLRFLSNFTEAVGLNKVPPGMLGMIEMVIVSSADTAFGTWWSTFTGHIFRMRGYAGNEKDCWYIMQQYRNQMQSWQEPEGTSGWWREWPTAWTMIDD